MTADGQLVVMQSETRSSDAASTRFVKANHAHERCSGRRVALSLVMVG